MNRVIPIDMPARSSNGLPNRVIQDVYRRSLRLYERKQGTGSLYVRFYENLIRLLATTLQAARGFTFPERKTGSWWWIWRWRFEALMGWYEQECTALCRQHIRPGSIVLDIGGHIGLYSRLFSRLVGPNGKVLVFEANPENVAVLKNNLRHPRYRNVEVVWGAVGTESGTIPLHVSPGHSNHSVIPGYTEAAQVIEVPAICIDSYLAEHGYGRVDFVKSDTEGAEPLVIRGMARTIASSPGLVLLLEYHPAALRCGAMAPEEFLADLRRRGLGISVIHPDGTLSGTLPDSAGNDYVNLLCQRETA